MKENKQCKMNRSFQNRSFDNRRRSNYNNYNQQNQCLPQDGNFIPLEVESSSPMGFQNRRFNYQNKWRNSGGYNDFGGRGRSSNYQHSPHSPYSINKGNRGHRMPGFTPNNSFQRKYRYNQSKVFIVWLNFPSFGWLWTRTCKFVYIRYIRCLHSCTIGMTVEM